MRQLSLFDRREEANERGSLDASSEALLHVFAERRLGEGASPRSVRREVSQLRSIVRESGALSGPLLLREVFSDVGVVARAIREPSVPISRATGRARLLAVQRFLRFVGPMLGHDAADDLAALDALLPVRRSPGWHAAGTIVAGETGRRRRRGPTLDTVDLARIVDAAAAGHASELGARDRALLAVQCFTGLRPEEVIGLRWEDVEAQLTSGGFYGLTAAVERRVHRLRLPLPGPVGQALEALKLFADGGGADPSGPVFRTTRGSDGPMSYRAARNVLVAACRRADLPAAEAAQLRAGCAHWLRAQGLSDHEVAAVLGLARVRSVDRLLARHAALDAQRRVREHVSSG